MKKQVALLIIAAFALFSACSENDETKDVSDKSAVKRSAPAAEDKDATVPVEKPVEIFYFYGSGCQNCGQVKSVIESLARDKRIRVKQYEVWYNKKNRDLLLKMARERNLTVRGVPAVIIGSQICLGIKEISDLGKKFGVNKQPGAVQPVER